MPKKELLTADFDYHLPPELISQTPIKPRDQARLLVLAKKTGRLSHHHFFELGKFLNPGDVLVLNDSKVIPARLYGRKANGAQREIFLLRKIKKTSANFWQVMIRGKVKTGEEIIFPGGLLSKIFDRRDDGTYIMQFYFNDRKLFSLGQTPLPPYIKKPAKLTDYQTIFAKSQGSVAAPTAGLHFTKKLINQLKKQGVRIEYLTLHVGLGTFQPVKTRLVKEHQIHSEWGTLTKATAQRLNEAKAGGHKIIAVGTTSVRTLEAFTTKSGQLMPGAKEIAIFIYPGYRFKFVDSIITNFHLPKSTLLMLVSAFANQPLIKKAYREAINKKYRFYSFGDAMLIE